MKKLVTVLILTATAALAGPRDRLIAPENLLYPAGLSIPMSIDGTVTVSSVQKQ